MLALAPFGGSFLIIVEEPPPVVEAFFDALFHAVFARFIVDATFREVSLRNVGAFVVMAVLVTLTVPKLFGRLVVCIAEMLGDSEGATFAHLRRGLSNGHGAAIALRSGSHVNGGVRQDELSFGQTDKLDRLLRCDRYNESIRIGHAHVFARADDEASRDEANVLTRQ